MAKMPPTIHHNPYAYPSTSYLVPAAVPPPLPTHHHQKPPLPPSSVPIGFQNNINQPSSRYPNTNHQFYNQPPPPSHNKNNRSSNPNHYQQSYQ